MEPGKTTTIKILTGQIPPTCGKPRIMGHDTTKERRMLWETTSLQFDAGTDSLLPSGDDSSCERAILPHRGIGKVAASKLPIDLPINAPGKDGNDRYSLERLGAIVPARYIDGEEERWQQKSLNPVRD
jgi:hypothetical protein